jgi:MFS family permease
VYVALLTWVLSAAIVVVVLYTPTYLQKVHHIPAALALEANALATLTLTIGCVLVGWASDRIGTRAVMLVGWGGLFATAYLFYRGCPARRPRCSGTTGWWDCSWAPSPRCRSPACARFRRRCASPGFRLPTTCRTRCSAGSHR